MTDRRLRRQALLLAAVVAVSVMTTGAGFVGSTVAQSSGPDNPGNGGGAGGTGTDSESNAGGGEDSNGGSNAGGGGDSNGGSNAGESADTDRGANAGGSADTDRGANAGESAGRGAGGAGAADSPGRNTPADGGADTAENAGGDSPGPPGTERGPDAADRGGPEIAEVGRQVSQATPSRGATVEIEDTEPETPGIAVGLGGETRTVSGVTLADESLRGNVEVKEYRDLPDSVTRSVAETVLRDIAAEQATENVETEGGNTTGPTENASGDRPAATDRVTVVTVANISVFDETGQKASDTPATVRMTVNRTDVTNPENAVVVHETDDGWEQLNTSLAEVTNESVTLTAETSGFSLFAVAELDTDDEESSTSTVSNETTETQSVATANSTPGFGIPAAVAAISGVALLLCRLRR